MLRVNARHFTGLSSADAEWLRGQLLAALGERQVPDSALGLIEEELRTSDSPVVLAGAARVLRRCGPGGASRRQLLESAKARLAGRDEFVSFAAAGGEASTARQTLDAALREEGVGERHCCGAKAAPLAVPVGAGAPPPSEALARAEIEDQDGRRSSLAGLAAGRCSLLALFYTRCMNPEKCSATIVGLARLARRLATRRAPAGVQVIGLSYDGAYDLPKRLKDYGADRSFPFGDRARLARCTRGWPELRRLLDLQVGYGGSTVNYHEREIFVIRPDLAIDRLPPVALTETERLLSSLEALQGCVPASDDLGDQSRPDRV